MTRELAEGLTTAIDRYLGIWGERDAAARKTELAALCCDGVVYRDKYGNATGRDDLDGHIAAAQVLVPRWLERGSGWFLATASAAGLLTQIGSAPYAVTKHAAVAFAEWLSITYGDHGIRVSCLCPQAVRTPMLEEALEDPAGAAALLADEVLEPSDVAEITLQAIRDERFLILPHPSVGRYMALKGAEPERWLAGMRKRVRRASSG